MAGVSYCVERKEKQPAARPGRCSIKWFINARQKEAQPASAGREREREGQPASIIQFTLPWLCSRAHTSTRPLPLSPSLALSHFLSHTHARLVTQTHARRGAEAVQCAVAPSSAPSPGCLWSSLIRTVSVLFSAVTDNSINKRCQRRAVSYCPLT